MKKTILLLIVFLGFHASFGGPKPHARPVISDEDGQKKSDGLVVEFELNRIQGGRYRKPYVAVWLEDSDGFPVKTAVLWVQTEQPGHSRVAQNQGLALSQPHWYQPQRTIVQ